MATLEMIRYRPFTSEVSNDEVSWRPLPASAGIDALPQIYWRGSSPWVEANQWLFERAISTDVALDTVSSDAKAIKTYATWLEENGVDWRDFPLQRRFRCLNKYRKHLLEQNQKLGLLRRSTAVVKMRTVIAMYRWLRDEGLIEPPRDMWQEVTVDYSFSDEFGQKRSVAVRSTNLKIPNRRTGESGLEDGLMPVSAQDRVDILKFAKVHASTELHLMLMLGFFTGMRVGSICDLRISTLKSAVRDPDVPGLYYLTIGPGAQPPVHTKFAITGRVPIYEPMLQMLLDYAGSIRRLKRKAKAADHIGDLLFFTPAGQSYRAENRGGVQAVNVAMSRLRAKCIAQGSELLRHFKFHQTRATFATELARALMAHSPEKALDLVRRYLLHRSVATTLKYIRYIEEHPLKEAASEAFLADFLGLICAAEPDA